MSLFSCPSCLMPVVKGSGDTTAIFLCVKCYRVHFDLPKHSKEELIAKLTERIDSLNEARAKIFARQGNTRYIRAMISDAVTMILEQIDRLENSHES